MKTVRYLTAALIWISLVGCGGGGVDNSFANPEWRASVPEALTFPLPERTALTVGLGPRMAAPEAGNPILQWIEEETNIELEFVVIPSSPGDIEFGELIRAGGLPDIIAEARVDLREPSIHPLFVNYLEFPGLLPNVRALLADSEQLRNATLARLTSDDQLLSLGTIDANDFSPSSGLLRTGRILVAQNLAANTWGSIRESMDRLKELYPDSYPFGGSFSAMLALMPSWFGSGYDPRHVVYFDPDAGEWRFGPYEQEFRALVAYLTEAFQLGLVDPSAVLGSDEQLSRSFINDVVFLAPYRGGTGPLFRFPADDYGTLTDEGTWSGDGRWVSSLPLPPAPNDGPRYVSTERWSPLSPGWLVYTQGENVGSAVALVDFLFSDSASRVLTLGPPGDGWQDAEGDLSLAPEVATAYSERGIPGLREALGTEPIPLSGRSLDLYEAFGPPDTPSIQYFLANDLATNNLGSDVIPEPGVRIPLDNEEFGNRRIDPVITLQTHVESQIANFIVGQRSLSEWDQFLDECRDRGADRLVDLYNELAVVPDPAILAPLTD